MKMSMWRNKRCEAVTALFLLLSLSHAAAAADWVQTESADGDRKLRGSTTAAGVFSQISVVANTSRSYVYQINPLRTFRIGRTDTYKATLDYQLGFGISAVKATSEKTGVLSNPHSNIIYVDATAYTVCTTGTLKSTFKERIYDSNGVLLKVTSSVAGCPGGTGLPQSGLGVFLSGVAEPIAF